MREGEAWQVDPIATCPPISKTKIAGWICVVVLDFHGQNQTPAIIHWSKIYTSPSKDGPERILQVRLP
jgi:hypothetical protein